MRITQYKTIVPFSTLDHSVGARRWLDAEEQDLIESIARTGRVEHSSMAVAYDPSYRPGLEGDGERRRGILTGVAHDKHAVRLATHIAIEKQRQEHGGHRPYELLRRQQERAERARRRAMERARDADRLAATNKAMADEYSEWLRLQQQREREALARREQWVAEEVAWDERPGIGPPPYMEALARKIAVLIHSSPGKQWLITELREASGMLPKLSEVRLVLDDLLARGEIRANPL